jgi:hypothetical protein
MGGGGMKGKINWHKDFGIIISMIQTICINGTKNYINLIYSLAQPKKMCKLCCARLYIKNTNLTKAQWACVT